MLICYVDEAGGFEAPNWGLDATPVMLFAGLIIDHRVLPNLTVDFLALKSEFFPKLCLRAPGKHLEHMLAEVKGSKVREMLRADSHRKRRHATRFLDEIVELLCRYNVRLVGRLWVKEPTVGIKPRHSYTFAMQDIACHFNHLLVSADDIGFLVCDGRKPNQDAEVSHSLFTQKHQMAGDLLPHVVESPLFGRSENHVGLQLADLVASTLLFPIATRTYCATSCATVHAHPRFDNLKTRYAARLKSLTYVYKDADGRIRGGIVVSDKVGHQSSGRLFRLP